MHKLGSRMDGEGLTGYPWLWSGKEHANAGDKEVARDARGSDKTDGQAHGHGSPVGLDNVAEIAMHEKLRMLFAMDSQYSSHMMPRKFPDHVRKKALWDFNEKIRLLVAQPDTISKDYGNVLRVGHLLRNEAYHRGIVRETIINEVARTYLDALCTILPRLWVGRLLIIPGEDIEGYLKQYGVDAKAIDNRAFASVCAHFTEGRGCTAGSLAGMLSADLIRRLDEVVEGLEYLAGRGYEPVSVEDVLKNLQFYPEFHEKHTFAKTGKGFLEFVRTRDREYAKYVPPIAMEVLDRWRNDAEALVATTAPGQALDLYAAIDKGFSEIEEAVGQAVFELDEWVNMEVHDRGL